MRLRFCLVLIICLWASGISRAQSDCLPVEQVVFPVDQTVFHLVQGFAAPNPRHLGQYHSGEDWYGGRGSSANQPVQAMANGRVTYANEKAWGVDGGVIILEHKMPDGTTLYSLYGHLASSPAAPFPSRLACVTSGQIIGVTVEDVRPAPHVHIELRSEGSDTPGAGYTRENPYTLGLLPASRVVTNWRAWLNDWQAWHVTHMDGHATSRQGLIAPPLLLSDNSLLYLDSSGTILRRLLPDGRILWRLFIDPSVALLGYQGKQLVVFADGHVQPLLDLQAGKLGEGWQIDAKFTGAPAVAWGWLLFPGPDNTLIALDADRRTVVWRMENVPPFTQAQVVGDALNFVVGLMTADNEFLLVSAAGTLLDRRTLKQAASLGQSPKGALLVYGLGGLWQVGLDGMWTLYDPAAPHGGEHSALLTTETGRQYRFDGKTLTAIGPEGQALWNTTLETPIQGRAELHLYGTLLLLSDSAGEIIAFNDGGRQCNQAQLAGDPTSRQWQSLGDDGVLRWAVADQLIGLKWDRFTVLCRS